MRHILYVLALIVPSFALAQPLAGPVPSTNGTLVNPTISSGSLSGTNVSGANVTATGTTGSRTSADRAADLVNVKDGRNGQPGAKGDGRIILPIVTLSGTALSTSAATFTASDVGKSIVIAGADVAPTSGTVWTVPVTTAGSGYTAAPTCAITDNSAVGTGAVCQSLLGVQTATLTTGGTCTDGSNQIFMVGLDGTGKTAQLTGSVTGGVLTGTLTVADPGLYSALGAVTSVPVYGANCTVQPTVSLSFGVRAINVSVVGANYSTTQTTAALTGGSPGTAATLGAPFIGAPIPPLKTTIAAYNSPTAVTLANPASTSISGVATKILIATDDSAAFQAASNASTGGVFIPGGIYWIPSKVDPGSSGSRTFRGEGMENTILIHDSGTQQTQNGAGWSPMFANLSGSHTAIKGNLAFESLQFRGLLDFGRVNTGASILELNFYNDLSFDRVKFYEVPNFSMAAEGMNRYRVTNSVFELVMRDQARCRSCFNAIIRGNQFLHTDDDSVALHQANYIQGAGNVREGMIVEGNTFEDSHGVSIVGARLAVIRGNVFRRNRIGAIRVSTSTTEGINPIFGITIADNLITDMMSRTPLTNAAAGISVSYLPPAAPTGITRIIAGGIIQGSAFSTKPWDFMLGNNQSGTEFAAGTRGINIHDNTIMRTLPAVAKYSDWGFGPIMSNVGLINPPVSDSALTPTAGISVSSNATGLLIHHNIIQNVRRGISLTDALTSVSQNSASISFNHIYDAWEYGVVVFGGGTGFQNFDLLDNYIDVDPYGISPGRTGGHGAWTLNYAASRCFSYGLSGGVVNMQGNNFANCYSIQTSPAWLIKGNMVRGTPWTGITGQPTSHTTANYGVAVYPSMVGDQFQLVYTVNDPSGSSPASYEALATSHIYTAATVPTTGYHVINDMIWSSAPGTCTCTGWLMLTTGSSWVSGTDYKVVPIQ